MKVFLTGVTGFLGSHIAEALCGDGHDVAALARDPAALHPEIGPLLSRPSSRLTLVRGSLFDAASLRAGCRESDAVVHVAGLIQARTEADYRKVNAQGTQEVLSAALDAAPGLRRFVLISSQAAGGPAVDGRPRTLTILRPPVVFGSRDRMLGRFFKAVARGRAVVWGDGSNAFNVVHAPDVARAVVLSLNRPHPSGSILYTADERQLDWRSFIETHVGVLRAGAAGRSGGADHGRKLAVMRVPPAIFIMAAALSTAAAFVTRRTPEFSFDKIAELREKAWLCSSAPTRELLGWVPATSIEDALAETHAWYRRAGLL